MIIIITLRLKKLPGVAAVTVHLQFVPHRTKVIPLLNLILSLLYLYAIALDEPTAFYADEMIVMFKTEFMLIPGFFL
jgi:hypothetical protein